MKLNGTTKTALVLALSALTSVSLANELWSNITSPAPLADSLPANSGTVMTGTLGTIPVTITALSGPAFYNYLPGSIFNSNIWDNESVTNYPGWEGTFPNNAGIYPASAKNATSQIVINHGNVMEVAFGSPVTNPIVLFYSLDLTTIDFSASRQSNGSPAIITATTNAGGVFDTATQVLSVKPADGQTGYAAWEGCTNYQTVGWGPGNILAVDTSLWVRRACGVMRFSGTYDKLNFRSTYMDNDGVGFQVGYALPPPPSVPVPLMSSIGIGALSLGLVAMGGWVVRRRKQQA